MKIFGIYLLVVAVMSLIAFFAYLVDKRKAQKGKWRVKESVLILLGFFGGAAGALLSMKIFRHKTKHWYFWLTNILFLIMHVVVAVWICLKFA